MTFATAILAKKHKKSAILTPGLFCWVLFVAILVVKPSSSLAQRPDSTTKWLEFPFEAVQGKVDHLGNVYLGRSGGILEKYSSSGKFLSRYSNNRLGEISAIDVSNPLEILLWFGSYRTAVVLDRNLTLLGSLNFLETEFPEVRSIAMSRDGNFWIYDEAAFRLRKIKTIGLELSSSLELTAFLDGQVTIFQIMEHNNRVLIGAGDRGWLNFDLYGQFSGVIPCPFRVENFSLIGERKILIQGNPPEIQVIEAQKSISLPLPFSGKADRYFIGGNCLFVILPNQTVIFQIGIK